MKHHLKPLLILLPLVAVVLYYLVALSNRSEFPKDANQNKAVEAPAYEHLQIENFKDWKGNSFPAKSADAPIIIVHFWASWCAPCIHEFPDLIKMTKAMKGKVKVFALSEDSKKEEITAFIKSFRDAETTENFHIVWDEGHEVMNKWDVVKLPESYIFGPDRKLAKQVSGVVSWSSNDTADYFRDLEVRAQPK